MFGCGWVVYARWWLDLVDLVVDDILIVDTFGLRVCVLYVVLIYRLRLRFGLGLVVSLVWCAVGRVLLAVSVIVLVSSFHYG